MWFYLALISSLVSAISVIVSKKLIKGVSATVLTWCTLVLATPLIFVFAIKEGIPSLNLAFIIGVSGSVILYTLSKVLGYRAMREANLSSIYPLVSLGPVFTLLVATAPPLSELPTVVSIIGVLIALMGVYVLNIGSLKEGIFKPIQVLFKNKASLLMIISVLIDSAVIIFDKYAINNTIPKNTTFTLLIENIFVIFGLLPVLFWRNGNFLREIKINIKLFLVLGFLNAVTTILAFGAVGGGNVGLVATIMKAQILLVLLFSLIVFKDKPKLSVVAGSILMIIGIVFIKVGS